MQIDWMSRDWRRIAVVVDGSETARLALPEAVQAACHHGARLTIISIAPRPWPWVSLAGVSPLRLEDDLRESAARRARLMAATLPAELPCTSYARCGGKTSEIAKILAHDPHDVLILAAGPGAARAIIRARWHAHRLGRRAAVDVVTVSPGSAGSRHLTAVGRPASAELDLTGTLPADVAVG